MAQSPGLFYFYVLLRGEPQQTDKRIRKEFMENLDGVEKGRGKVPYVCFGSCRSKPGHKMFTAKNLELHPICLPVGLPVSVSYQPSSVGIFGMVFGINNS